MAQVGKTDICDKHVSFLHSVFPMKQLKRLAQYGILLAVFDRRLRL